MRLHEKIKILRKKKGVSQQELADKIGLHITYVSRLENGHSQPSMDVLKKLIEVFEVSADYLLNDDTDDYEVRIKDKGLAERIRMLDKLDENDRQALTQVIDSMLTKQKMRQVLNQETAINQ